MLNVWWYFPCLDSSWFKKFSVWSWGQTLIWFHFECVNTLQWRFRENVQGASSFSFPSTNNHFQTCGVKCPIQKVGIGLGVRTSSFVKPLTNLALPSRRLTPFLNWHPLSSATLESPLDLPCKCVVYLYTSAKRARSVWDFTHVSHAYAVF